MPLLSRPVTAQLVAAVVIVGALLRKEYMETGHWVTVAAIATYLLFNLGRTVKTAPHFRSLSVKEKARVVIFGLLLYIAVDAAVTMSVSYFVVLILLAVDYMLEDPRKDSARQDRETFRP